MTATKRQLKVRARVMAGEGFIYVAEVIGTDLVKIGFTLDPERCPQTLKQYFPRDFRIIGYTPGSIKQAHAVHARLRPWRQRRRIHPNANTYAFYDRDVLRGGLNALLGSAP